jgi:Domain of unknown function (DUF4124)
VSRGTRGFFLSAKSPLSATPTDWCLAVKYCAQLLVFALVLSGSATAETRIYKTKDANGNVSFTDVPPLKDGKQEDPIVLKETNTWAGPSTDQAAKRTPWIVDEKGDETTEVFVPYSTLSIVNPANDASVRENSGDITVSVSIFPPLVANQQLRLLMDGKTVGQSSGPSFPIENVDRGTHSLLLEVVDSTGRSLQQSSVTTFHLQRYHLPPANSKPKKKPG